MYVCMRMCACVCVHVCLWAYLWRFYTAVHRWHICSNDICIHFMFGTISTRPIHRQSGGSHGGDCNIICTSDTSQWRVTYKYRCSRAYIHVCVCVCPSDFVDSIYFFHTFFLFHSAVFIHSFDVDYSKCVCGCDVSTIFSIITIFGCLSSV